MRAFLLCLSLFVISGCGSLKRVYRSTIDPGYTSWTIAISEACSNPLDVTASALERLEFDIAERSSGDLSTAFRRGSKRQEPKKGGLLTALNNLLDKGATEYEIKITAKLQSSNSTDNTRILIFETKTRDPFKNSSYERSRHNSPTWTFWQDDITELNRIVKSKCNP